GCLPSFTAWVHVVCPSGGAGSADGLLARRNRRRNGAAISTAPISRCQSVGPRRSRARTSLASCPGFGQTLRTFHRGHAAMPSLDSLEDLMQDELKGDL